MRFESFPTMDVVRDDDGIVRHIDHLREPVVGERNTPRELAEEYLRQYAEMYSIAPSLLQGLGREVASEPDDTGSELRPATAESTFGLTVVQYAQTYFGLPVWEAGVTIVVAEEPPRVMNSRSTVHLDVSVRRPSADAIRNAQSINSARLAEILALSGENRGEKGEPRINATKLRVYRYDPANRFDPELNHHEEGDIPSLPLPQVPKSIVPGDYYVVQEVYFTLSINGIRGLNWVCFIEVETGAVLMLRAMIAGATAKVFLRDPYRQGAPGTVTPLSNDTTLNTYRSTVTLLGLPAPGTLQTLDSNSNEFVKLQDFDPPTDAPPTQATPFDFTYNASTGGFAAANAYYHSDRVFRFVRDLIGQTDFNGLFDGTTFPVHVDHRAAGNAVNAFGLGNGTGTGSDGFTFGVCASGSTLGIATESAVVWHEFGHAILWDALHSPNFGFVHSCGDSFGVIMNDADSIASDRFLTFPFISAIPRRHDRPVSTWAWGGNNDDGGYGSEEILSTTLFRIYRSMGGDSSDYNRKLLARNFLMYIIAKAIKALGSGTITPTPIPDVFSTALQIADTTTTTWQGHVGGAYHKVIRWGFEKQGVYQLPGTPTPITAPGAPPAVDVYIDDGRGGEYQYQPVWWANQNIWNRHAADGIYGNQDPKLNVTNYIYVRLRNRGQNTATNVEVRAYHCTPGGGLIWPFGWTVMTPAFISAPNVPAGPGFIDVGPFSWIPTIPSPNHECVLAYVKATGDPSNAETIFGPGPIPEWRLVPHDNNIGQRNLNAVAGLHGGITVKQHFADAKFTVRNPFDVHTEIRMVARLPRFMEERLWKVVFTNGDTFELEVGGEREVTLAFNDEGAPFTAADIPDDDRMIIITIIGIPELGADPGPEVPGGGEAMVTGGGEIGGMAYEIDPTMDIPRDIPPVEG